MTREEFDSLVESITSPGAREAQAATVEEVEHTDAPVDAENPINDMEVQVPDEINPLLGTSRFSGATWADRLKRLDLTFLGVGGIGSWAAFIASRFRPSSMTLFDMDEVDPANMSGQLYGVNDANKKKAHCLSIFINNYSGVYPTGATQMVTEDTFSEWGMPIVICGFDNMVARKAAFKGWRSKYEGNESALFIDARMSIDTCQIYSFTGDDKHAINKYASEALFSDEEADATICSMKQTSYVAAIMGGLISNLLVQFVESKIGIPMNYFTEYNAATMTLKTM